MRKLFLLAGLFLCLSSIAQTGPWPFPKYQDIRGQRFNGLDIINEVYLPRKDTNWTPGRPGAVVLMEDSVFYGYGQHWFRIGSTSSGSIVSGNFTLHYDTTFLRAVDDTILSLNTRGIKNFIDSGYKNSVFLDWSNLNSWGVDTTGATDNTILVNSAISWVAANSFDKTLKVSGRVRVDGRLTYNRSKVMLIGTGKILSKEILNFGEIEVGSLTNSFFGRINKPYNSFPKTSQKIYSGDTVNIVVWGNSITSGYDYVLGTGGHVPSSFNQSDRSSSWYEEFLREMENRFSGRPIKIFNRSAAGFSMADFTRNLIDFSPSSAVERFMTDANKNSSWVLSVKDCNPDLIILSLGMNDNTSWLKYAVDMKSELNTWAKVPEVVVLSTPTPNYVTNSSFPDIGGVYRVDKMGVAKEQMLYSDIYKFYNIDVARQQAIKRYGTDYRNFSFKPSDGFSIIPQTGVTTTSNSITFPVGTKNVKINRFYKSNDFAIEFTYRQNGSLTYWRLTDSLYSILSIEGGTVYQYPFVSTGGQEGLRTASYTFVNGVDYRIRAEISSKAMSFYVNDTLISRAPMGSFIVTDPVLQVANATSTVLFTNIVLYDAVYSKYRPNFTGNDIWGDGLNLNNGNNINHPSTVGVNEIYNPPVREFVSDLYDAAIRNANVVEGWKVFTGDSILIGYGSRIGEGNIVLKQGNFSNTGTITFMTPNGRRVGALGNDTSYLYLEGSQNGLRLSGNTISDGSIAAGLGYPIESIGSVRLHKGTFAQSGYLEIFNPSGQRTGTFGAGTKDLNIEAETGKLVLGSDTTYLTGGISTFQPASGVRSLWNFGAVANKKVNVGINGKSYFLPLDSLLTDSLKVLRDSLVVLRALASSGGGNHISFIDIDEHIWNNSNSVPMVTIPVTADNLNHDLNEVEIYGNYNATDGDWRRTLVTYGTDTIFTNFISPGSNAITPWSMKIQIFKLNSTQTKVVISSGGANAYYALDHTGFYYTTLTIDNTVSHDIKVYGDGGTSHIDQVSVQSAVLKTF